MFKNLSPTSLLSKLDATVLMFCSLLSSSLQAETIDMCVHKKSGAVRLATTCKTNEVRKSIESSSSNVPTVPNVYDADGQLLGQMAGSAYHVYISNLAVTAEIVGYTGQVGNPIYDREPVFFKTSDCSGAEYHYVDDKVSMNTTLFSKPNQSQASSHFVRTQIIDQALPETIKSSRRPSYYQTYFYDQNCQTSVSCVAFNTQYYTRGYENACVSTTSSSINEIGASVFTAYAIREVDVPFTSPVKFPLSFR